MATTPRSPYGFTLQARAEDGAVLIHADFERPVNKLVVTLGGFPMDLGPTEYVVTASSPEVPAAEMNWSYSKGLRSCFRYLPAANSRGLSTVPTLSLAEPARVFDFRVAGRVSPRASVSQLLRTISLTAPSLPPLDARLFFWPTTGEWELSQS